MASITTIAATDFVAGDAQKYFMEPLFLGNDVLAKFDVMTSVKGNTYLDVFTAAQKMTKADNGGAFSASGAGYYMNLELSPKRVEAEISVNGGDFYDKVKGQVLRSGTSKDNVDGTVLKEIASKLLMQGIMRDFNRQLWFGWTSATANTNTAIGADYNVYDGVFRALYYGLPNAQRIVASYSTNIANKAATVALESVYQAATAELKELPKTFYVSGQIADDYERELTSEGNHLAYTDLQSGISSLNFRGIPISVRRDWDVVLENDYDHVIQIQAMTGDPLANAADAVGTTALGARIALIADGALTVGTDFQSANVESWYNQDQKELRFRIGYICAAQMANAKLGVLYGN